MTPLEIFKTLGSPCLDTAERETEIREAWEASLCTVVIRFLEPWIHLQGAGNEECAFLVGPGSEHFGWWWPGLLQPGKFSLAT